MSVRILTGHVIERLAELPDGSVQCVVTSPPYWGLRDYGIEPQAWGADCRHEWGDEIAGARRSGGTASSTLGEASGGHAISDDARLRSIERSMHGGQSSALCSICGAWRGSLGLEPTFGLYVEHMVAVFREVRRVLRADGTLWLNLGDSYNNADKWGGGGANTGKHTRKPNGKIASWEAVRRHWSGCGLKPKDLCGIPWRVAFALQDDGWWLRQDIIWSKPNPMPESVRDRCTKAHEYLFLLSKSERYHFDQEAILEPCSPNTHARLSQDVQAQIGSARVPGKTNGNMKAVARRGGGNRSHKGTAAFEGGFLVHAGQVEHRTKAGLVAFADKQRKLAEAGSGIKNNDSMDAALAIMPTTRNRRSVWEIATQPFSEAHFATFPPALVEPCILAGCPEGGTVLDPFGGSGTVGLVADRLNRDAILIELNPAYAAMARRRIEDDAGMFAEVAE